MRAENYKAVELYINARGWVAEEIEEYDFEDWLERARRATQEAVDFWNRNKNTDIEESDAGEGVAGQDKYKFKEGIWGDLKQYLFDLFRGKCGYCEARVRHVSHGDVEHYRPKRKLAEAGADHPGYYFLAYDETNLLPSCQPCNQVVKKNRFPVRDGFWAQNRDEISREKPLLLNPYGSDDFAKHLTFLPVRLGDLPLSRVQSDTEEGITSIEIYGLDRPDLQEDRGEQMLHVFQEWTTACLAGEDAHKRFWNRLRSGEAEYSLAKLAQMSWILGEAENHMKERAVVRSIASSGSSEDVASYS